MHKEVQQEGGASPPKTHAVRAGRFKPRPKHAPERTPPTGPALGETRVDTGRGRGLTLAATRTPARYSRLLRRRAALIAAASHRVSRCAWRQYRFCAPTFQRGHPQAEDEKKRAGRGEGGSAWDGLQFVHSYRSVHRRSHIANHQLARYYN